MRASYFSQIALFFLSLPLLLCTSCTDDGFYAPKPKGYFRVQLPKKEYVPIDSLDCPFRFEIPSYSYVQHYKRNSSEYCWMNLQFPTFNSTLHISYKALNNNLERYSEDARSLAMNHQVKSSGIREQFVANDSTKVFGLVYTIEGNAASLIQFHLTDSSNHFLQASFYFNSKPNKDSVAPVMKYLREDIVHFVESFEWK